MQSEKWTHSMVSHTRYTAYCCKQKHLSMCAIKQKYSSKFILECYMQNKIYTYSLQTMGRNPKVGHTRKQKNKKSELGCKVYPNIYLQFHISFYIRQSTFLLSMYLWFFFKFLSFLSASFWNIQITSPIWFRFWIFQAFCNELVLKTEHTTDQRMYR